MLAIRACHPERRAGCRPEDLEKRGATTRHLRGKEIKFVATRLDWRSGVKRLLRRAGFSRAGRWEWSRPGQCPANASPEERKLWNAVCTETMTSPARVFALRRSVRGMVEGGVPGAVVECGVWRGGSMLAVALTLLEMGDTSRDLFLFDTFAGMTQPSDEDRRGEKTAAEMLADSPAESFVRAEASLDEVRRNMNRSGYPRSRIHFVEGRVEDTVPGQAPGSIALLRLDTDWYESTRHELIHLWPQLSPGGVLILDDYGDWEGARKAVDEWLEGMPGLSLETIDYTGRILMKPR